MCEEARDQLHLTEQVVELLLVIEVTRFERMEKGRFQEKKAVLIFQLLFLNSGHYTDKFNNAIPLSRRCRNWLKSVYPHGI
jgi:hypothetical protein